MSEESRKDETARGAAGTMEYAAADAQGAADNTNPGDTGGCAVQNKADGTYADAVADAVECAKKAAGAGAAAPGGTGAAAAGAGAAGTADGTAGLGGTGAAADGAAGGATGPGGTGAAGATSAAADGAAAGTAGGATGPGGAGAAADGAAGGTGEQEAADGAGEEDSAKSSGKKEGLFKKKKKTKEQEQIEELNDRVKRQLAEFENFRKRTEKEKTQMFETGAKSIIEKILPVVDNFERGLAALSEEEKTAPFAEGMDKVYKQLMTMLTDVGVTPIEAEGKEFDPNLHNAVMHIEDESLGENMVAQELQKGYLYHDSVVRHSMVQVAN